MPRMDLTDARWRKSSYSGGDHTEGACVEVGFAGGAVAVRDSKNPASGVLLLTSEAWLAFTTLLRS